ncbi:hypothetical protein [Planomicrobium sp. YIM 101495]|uniref:hypothetical protein n=1 Tax=Planomicrobium sp. YIM 101495 TaxID=2665160 RepID=UPI0012B9F377|nr:hypothetical protein [Planomicrobium sp. YIM 101495]MTD30129.1 hypothetical protein [Planomicrobium sp. YIM 101495]
MRNLEQEYNAREKLESEIKEAKEKLWGLMVQGENEENIENLAAYVRYLEREIQDSVVE